MAKTKWEGDVLDRKPAAEYLYRLVVERMNARHSKPGSGAVCVALEAEWGAGKTFFLEHWAAELADQGHVVVRFNAWENDLSEDPLLGFMAALRESLAPQLARVPVAARVELESVVKKAARAVLPASKLIAKALLKKATGIVADEITDSIDSTMEAAGDAALESAPEALEAYFEHALKAHTDRQRAIQELRRSIEQLVVHLEKEAGFQPPLFVLIDELDRCRPDYAIRLLEGIKHLFNARGVCFVLATNLDQLAAAAQAVYGSAFDGHTYLQRFFSFEYHLPEPDHYAYAQKLTAESSLLGPRLWSALPAEGDSCPEKVLATNFALASKAMGLSLRAQNQVFERAEAAAAGLPDGSHLYPYHLFVLSAVFQRNASVLRQARDGADSVAGAWQRVGGRSISVPYQFVKNGQLVRDAIRAVDLLDKFEGFARSKIQSLGSSKTDSNYPGSLVQPILNEPPASHLDGYPSLARYIPLVLRAGMALGGDAQR